MLRRLRLEPLHPVRDRASCSARPSAARSTPTSAATMHAQAEGVPFILEELARTYREAGMIQQIDGVWTLGRNADRLVPSAVRTLIQRRAARLPGRDPGGAGRRGVLGRSFSLRDLARDPAACGDASRTRRPGRRPRSGGDGGLLLRARRRRAGGLHLQPRAGPRVRVDELCRRAGAGHPRCDRRSARRRWRAAPASLALLARHALAAGDEARARRFRSRRPGGPRANAPEEALGSSSRRCRSPRPRRTACAAARATTPSRCSRARPSAWRGSPSWRPWPRRWATPAWSSRSCCGAPRRSGWPRTPNRPPTSRAGSGPWPWSATMRPRSWPPAWSWRRGCCGPLGESFSPCSQRGRPRRGGGGLERPPSWRGSWATTALAAATRELGAVDRPVRDWFVERSTPVGSSDFMRRIGRGESSSEISPSMPIAPWSRRPPPVRAGPRALRAARRSPGRDVHDHRHGVRELCARDPPGLVRSTSRRSGG